MSKAAPGSIATFPFRYSMSGLASIGHSVFRGPPGLAGRAALTQLI
jgi:hypothetical protein